MVELCVGFPNRIGDAYVFVKNHAADGIWVLVNNNGAKQPPRYLTVGDRFLGYEVTMINPNDGVNPVAALLRHL